MPAKTEATRELATLRFNEADSRRAFEEWGSNCGPNALAFALGMTLDEIRPHMGDFERKRYTNPMLMKAAIASAGGRIGHAIYERTLREFGTMPTMPTGLMRVQWAGPWTEPGANPKWAYRQTHWVAPFWANHRQHIFDCNGGIMLFGDWKKTIVPLLVATYPRASGEWYATHAWEILW